ncbi:daunorubicin resistance protein DrrA family ABC transporter ATP-binding protein [Pseudoalteromonas sp. A25]|uniref:ABC transporter ATP-binding protein n=1 Tax=Pseudoalteromonas sp. A25 TaxID=116092 RepID=UPI00129F36CF|nr:ABC transporter ATP-binding protein [Pseudoalteromonas sp. A25]BBN83063.1 daunorubicin resistance protein DrrA family ABC transporter ATP-binding protein [Pseudoalteromonas sp. A25]
MIKAENISKRYKSSEGTVNAVSDVSLTIEDGEILGFLGLNGAGKTTMIKILAGLIEPDEGSISINGVKSAGKLQVSALLEGHRNLYWRMSAMENLEYFGVLRGLSAKAARQRAEELLQMFNLSDKAEQYVQKLSRGMQQRLAVCVAMVHNPQVLLLDEPTLGIDFDNTQALVESINKLKEQGTSILITTHELSVAEKLSDRVAIITKGQLVADNIKPKLLNENVKDFYQLELGVDIDETLKAQLSALSVDVSQRSVSGIADEHIYEVMNLAKPRPVISLTRVAPDFEKVFLSYARS